MTDRQTVRVKSNNAFTLAEVLITLGIIGVIAAITITLLINIYNIPKVRTELQKAYSDLSQAYIAILADNNGTFKGICSTDACVKQLFIDKMKIIKECTSANSNGICIGASQTYLNPSLGSVSNSLDSFITANGVSISIWGTDINCSSLRAVINGTNSSCGIIQVDINGLRTPNKIGEDIYIFHILANKILPVGGNYSYSGYQYCDSNSNSLTAGNGCAFTVLNGGWHN